MGGSSVACVVSVGHQPVGTATFPGHFDTAPVGTQERGGDVLVALGKGLGGQRGRCRSVWRWGQCPDAPRFWELASGDWELTLKAGCPHPAHPTTRRPSPTPEAFQPIAPGWRDRAYPGSCASRSTHPEGGAKIPAPSCNPSRVGDPFRRSPGCASRPRATRFNASGVAHTHRRVRARGLQSEFLGTGLWQLATHGLQS